MQSPWPSIDWVLAVYHQSFADSSDSLRQPRALEGPRCRPLEDLGVAFSRGLYINDAALHSDHGGLCPVLSTQLREDVFDPRLDRLFRNR
jgi:hypothetical protein